MFLAIIPVAIAFFFLSPVIVAAILLFPYGVLIFKRLRMLRHLYKTAELCGYRVRPLHKRVCFSRNLADKYDILIENEERAYVVKLWSAKKTDNTLIINKDGTVCESSVVPGGLSSEDKYEITGKPLAVPVTRCNFRVKKTKTLELILLYYPENDRVYVDCDGKRTPIVEGQKIFGKRMLTPKTFEKILRRHRAANKQKTLANSHK